MSSRMGWRSRNCSIHNPDNLVNSARFRGCVNTSVSKRPIWLVEAAVCSVARPPTTCLMVGSTASRSASLVSSYPASRLKIDCRSSATSECCVFFRIIIDQETFDRVQAILKGRRPTLTPHERNHPDFPLRVFVKCATCGQPMTGSWSRGRNKKYPYYYCPGRCRGINVRKEKLGLEFTKLLERMQVRHENVALFHKIVVDQWEEKQDCTINLLAACQRQIKELGDRKQNLLDAFVYQKAIDKESYEQQRDKLEEEITLAKLRLKDAQLDEVDVEAILNFAETFLLNTARIWMEMSLEQRQRF